MRFNMVVSPFAAVRSVAAHGIGAWLGRRDRAERERFAARRAPSGGRDQFGFPWQWVQPITCPFEKLTVPSSVSNLRLAAARDRTVPSRSAP
jgi:hypothetical protein